MNQECRYTCAPGKAERLGITPTSVTKNLAMLEKLAGEFTEKHGREHSIYRESMGLWHKFKTIWPSEATLIALKEFKRVDTLREAKRRESCDNPFAGLTMERRCEIGTYLLRYLMPESLNLGDESPTEWIARRLPTLIHD